MKQKFYSVWSVEYNRWTILALHCPGHSFHGFPQTQHAPYLLSKDQADEWARLINIRTRANGCLDVEVRAINPKQIDKIIPDFPLDTTMPILQAGYIQDRQRKKYKP